MLITGSLGVKNADEQPGFNGPTIRDKWKILK